MAIQQGFPNISAPLTDSNGKIQQSWFQLLITLWNRTGAGPGGPLTVDQGGTGDEILDAHGVLLGQGLDPVTTADPGLAGQYLGSNGPTSDPTFQPVVVDASNLTGTTLAPNVVNSSLTKVGTLITGVWNATLIAVGFGGTGRTTLTSHGVLIGAGTSPVNMTSSGTTGQILTSNGAGADPTFQNNTALTGTATVHDVIVGAGSNTVTAITPGTSGFVLTSNGVSADPSFQALASSNPTTAWFVQQQTSGTNGPDSLSIGVWGQRSLNTTKVNTIPSCTLTSNQISLAAGTYEVNAFTAVTGASGGTNLQAQSRIYNITDSAVLVAGPTSIGMIAAVPCQLVPECIGQFTLSGTKTIELDTYYAGTSGATGGLALAAGVETYASIYLRKIA